MKEFPDGVPIYDADDTLLLYPTDDAVYLEDLDPEVFLGTRRIVVIESTWQKGKV